MSKMSEGGVVEGTGSPSDVIPAMVEGGFVIAASTLDWWRNAVDNPSSDRPA